MTAPLLEVSDLVKHFPILRGVLFPRQVGAVRAVDGVSFTVARGETLGLVGESGSGKSTLARVLLCLLHATSGDVKFEGRSILGKGADDMRLLRQSIQMVFQDPFSSLNPRMTAGDAIAESLRVYGVASGAALKARVADLLERVGLGAEAARRFPHEFSGGQRQRIGIARALAISPKLVICDEPVSALDVSVQAQVINLLQDLQEELGLTYLFISHDLSIVKHVSDRVAVMYLGKLVEIGEAEELFRAPLHPYTEALLSAIPEPDADREREQFILEGDIPSPANPPSGCRFHTRCRYAMPICKEIEPKLKDAGEGHLVACHLRT